MGCSDWDLDCKLREATQGGHDGGFTIDTGGGLGDIANAAKQAWDSSINLANPGVVSDWLINPKRQAAGLKDQPLLRGIKEGVGELTGANASREDLYEARVAALEEVKARQKMLADQIDKQRFAEKQAANAASNSQAAVVRSGSRASLQYGDVFENRDFLGL